MVILERKQVCNTGSPTLEWGMYTRSYLIKIRPRSRGIEQLHNLTLNYRWCATSSNHIWVTMTCTYNIGWYSMWKPATYTTHPRNCMAAKLFTIKTESVAQGFRNDDYFLYPFQKTRPCISNAQWFLDVKFCNLFLTDACKVKRGHGELYWGIYW